MPSKLEFTLENLAEQVGGRIAGDGSRLIRGIATAAEAESDHLTFFTHPRYRESVRASRAAAVLCEKEENFGKPLLVCSNAYAALGRLLEIFYPQRKPDPGVHPSAVVDPEAKVDAAAVVLENAVIRRGARVGARTVIGAGAVVDEEACIGSDCVLGTNSVVGARCRLGDRVILQPGAVVGAEGFGFAWDGERYRKVPQVGIAVLEDDVELGANSCVDRALLGETRIGAGTKIDNLVQIGHNVVIGRHGVLAGQAGVSGSTHIGDFVRIGGQVGLAGHLKVGHRVSLAAQTGVMEDLPDGGTFFGSPSMPMQEAMKAAALYRKLPEIWKRLLRLEKHKSNTGKKE